MTRALRTLGLICAVLTLTAATGEFAVPAALVATLVAGGIGYGITKNKADTAHERVTALDTRVSAQLASMDAKLDTLLALTARLDERTGDLDR